MSDDQQTGYCRTSLPTRISLTTYPFSYLLFPAKAEITSNDIGNGLICKKLEKCFCQCGHWQPVEQPIGRFQQCYNQQINRGTRSTKQMVLWTGVAMIVEWWNDFLRWIVKSSTFGIATELESPTNDLQIHQIINATKKSTTIVVKLIDLTPLLASGFLVVLCSRGISG